MIGVALFLIVLAVIFVDHRLAKLVKIQRELLDIERQQLEQQRENAKALQWMVNNSKGGV